MELSNQPPFDPRAVANLILDKFEKKGKEITHLGLQKLLYFAHGRCLCDRNVPLVTGHFEAWRYGPVHPAVHRELRGTGRHPIEAGFRVQSLDIVTGKHHPIPDIDNSDVIEVVDDTLRIYGECSPSVLVSLSHAEGAPWHFVVEKSQKEPVVGLRISNQVIIQRFDKHRAVLLSRERNKGERIDGKEKPFSRHRLRSYSTAPSRRAEGWVKKG